MSNPTFAAVIETRADSSKTFVVSPFLSEKSGREWLAAWLLKNSPNSEEAAQELLTGSDNTDTSHHSVRVVPVMIPGKQGTTWKSAVNG